MFQIDEFDVSHPLFDKAGLCLSLIACLLPASLGQSLHSSGSRVADVLLKIEAVRERNRNTTLGDLLASLLEEISR